MPVSGYLASTTRRWTRQGWRPGGHDDANPAHGRLPHQDRRAVDGGAEEAGHRLRRDLSALDLTVLGVAVVIGTGTFVLTGKAAGVQAGPAVVISFVVAGVTCALAGLCYAEFASMLSVAGSAYTFSYATPGEVIAWVIGWDLILILILILILELALGASTVAVGWSQ